MLSNDATDHYAELVDRLFELKADTDSEGESRPALLRLSDGAISVMADYVNRNGREQNDLTGHTASQWSKLEEIPARVAIILHCLTQVASGVSDPWTVDRGTIESAVTIAGWFKDETTRVNRLLSEDEKTRNTRQRAEWIRLHGGEITANELRRSRRHRRNDIARAESLLKDLVERGFGRMVGIHKSQKFVLHDVSTNSAPNTGNTGQSETVNTERNQANRNAPQSTAEK